MRNLIVLLFLIIACNAFAGPATFQGNNVKLFKDRLLFNSGVSIATSESEDPTIVAKDGLTGSLYIRSTTGVVYSKQDNGVTTNWKPIAKYPVDLEDGKILVGNASDEATAVSMSGEATIANTGAVTLDNGSVIGKILTGHTAGSGTVAATDTISEAIEKLDGNDGLNLKLDQTTPQSVINGAPIFDQIDTNTAIANPTHNEGKIFYDSTRKAVSYYNEEADVTINLGQELVFRALNNTGATITNGAVVYRNAANEMGLATNHLTDKSKIIGVATHSVETGTYGYATRYGSVSDVDTSAFLAGDILYLGVNGALTKVKPNDGNFAVVIGTVGVVSATVGTINVDIINTDLTSEVTDTNGFPVDQRTNTSMTVTGTGPYQFNIIPSGTEFHYYVLGEKFEQIGTISKVFDDTIEGEHWFYFDQLGLQVIANPTAAQKKQVILEYAFAGYINWNATGKVIVGDIWDERHGIAMSPTTHAYLHLTRGAQFIEGFGIGNITLGTGALATDAQFSVAMGMIADEDIMHDMTSNINVGTAIPVLYITGAAATPVLREGTQAGYAVLNATAGRLYYNQNNAGTWQLTEATDNRYILYHIFATNGQDKSVFSVMGQAQYSSIGDARTAASTEISNIKLGISPVENVPIGTLIFQTRNTYVNATKSRIVEAVSGGDDYIDWRTTDLAMGAAPTSHANLTNVEIAGTGITQGHINDQAQTIAGAKTFSGAITASNLSGTNTGDQAVLNTVQLEQATTAIDPMYIRNKGAEIALVTTGSAGTDYAWYCNNSTGFGITQNVTPPTPQIGVGDFQIDVVAANASVNDYCEYAFTLQEGHKTEMLEVAIEKIKYDANYINGDIQICLYDATAGSCIRTDRFFDTTTKHRSDYQMPSTTDIRLRFTLKRDANMVINIDNVDVKPTAPSVTGTGEWKQYAMTVTGWDTTQRAVGTPYKTLDGTWRLNFNIAGTYTVATGAASAAISITGVVFNGNFNFTNGQAISGGAQTAAITTSTLYAESGSARIVFQTSANDTKFSFSGDVELASKPTWAVDYSNVVLSSSTSNRMVRVEASGCAVTAITAVTTPIPFIETTDSHNAFDGTTFTAPQDDTYRVSGVYLISPDGTRSAYLYKGTSLFKRSAEGFTGTGTVAFNFEVPMLKGETIHLRDQTGGNTVNVPSLHHISISSTGTGSQTIGKLPVLFEKYNTIASTISNSLTTGGTIIATNKVRSTHGAYNTATGIFTAPDDRLYEVCFAVRHDSPTMSSGNTFVLLVGGDSVATSNFNHHVSMLTATTVRHSGCTTFYGTKGEQAWLRAFHLNAVGTEPFNGLSQYNWITWRSVD